MMRARLIRGPSPEVIEDDLLTESAKWAKLADEFAMLTDRELNGQIGHLKKRADNMARRLDLLLDERNRRETRRRANPYP